MTATPGRRLDAEGMVLLGHLHTHEFAAGGTTDQVGNPWAPGAVSRRLERRLGCGARLRMVPARDRHGHGRLASHPLRDVRHLDDQADAGLVSMRGIVPLAVSSTTPARWPARSRDCEPLLAAMAGGRRPPPSALARSGSRPRSASPAARALAADRRARPDVAEGFETALAAWQLGAERVEPPPPSAPLDARAGLPRRALRRAARLPPPLRRPARALPSVDRDLGRHAESRATTARTTSPRRLAGPRPTACLGRLARGAPDRRDRRAHGPDRGSPLRGDGYDEAFTDYAEHLADPLLGLDRLPGRRAPVRGRQRAAGFRSASR